MPSAMGHRSKFEQEFYKGTGQARVSAAIQYVRSKDQNLRTVAGPNADKGKLTIYSRLEDARRLLRLRGLLDESTGMPTV